MTDRKRHPIRLALVGLALVLGAGLLAAVYVRAVVPDLPALRQGQTDSLALASVVYSVDGEQLTRLYRENRTWVDLEHVAPIVVEALVATEDRRFWDHAGVDVMRMVGAAWETAHGRRQGASTLTMQLARNRFEAIGRAPTWRRKLSEIVTALEVERRYTKPEIVELYLNTVTFGHRAHGIEQAARTYFSVSAARLDTAQAALLVALLRGPSRYDPLRHPDRARARRDLVLALMAEHGVLEEAALERLRRRPLGLRYAPSPTVGPLAPHFIEHVRDWLERWAAVHGHDLYAGGLRIHTTLDARLQRHANRALRRQLDALQLVAADEWSVPRPTVRSTDPTAYAPPEHPFAYFWQTHPRLQDDLLRRTGHFDRLTHSGVPPDSALTLLQSDAALVDSVQTAYARLEAGLVAIDPMSGHVRAWVGGRDFARDQYDKVALARRQPGSTFKPFVYATAVERGFSPDDTLRFNDTRRALSLRDGLAWSSNTAAMHLVHEVGPHAAVEMAHRLGIRSRLDPVPALALGSEEVTLLELTSAYATLSGDGLYRNPTVVTRIENHRGRVLYQTEPAPQRAASEATAYTVVDMLRDVVERGTGADVGHLFGLEGDFAGKTGTSQQNVDGWFMLMHPRLVTGAWVGFNDRRLHFRTDHWGGGGHNALRVAADFVRSLQRDDHARLPHARFAPPSGYRPPLPFRTARPDTLLAAPEPSAHDAPRLSYDAEAMLREAAPPPAATSPARPPAPVDAESLLRRRLADTLRTTSRVHE